MANFSSVTLCQPRAWISTFWMNQEKEKKHVHCFFLICKRHLYSRIEFSIELQRWRNSDRLFWDIEWLQLRQTSPGEPPPQGGVLDVFLFEFWGKHLKRFPVFYLRKLWGKRTEYKLFLLLNRICGSGQAWLCGIRFCKNYSYQHNHHNVLLQFVQNKLCVRKYQIWILSFLC